MAQANSECKNNDGSRCGGHNLKVRFNSQTPEGVYNLEGIEALKVSPFNSGFLNVAGKINETLKVELDDVFSEWNEKVKLTYKTLISLRK